MGENIENRINWARRKEVIVAKIEKIWSMSLGSLRLMFNWPPLLTAALDNHPSTILFEQNGESNSSGECQQDNADPHTILCKTF